MGGVNKYLVEHDGVISASAASPLGLGNHLGQVELQARPPFKKNKRRSGFSLLNRWIFCVFLFCVRSFRPSRRAASRSEKLQHEKVGVGAASKPPVYNVLETRFLSPYQITENR